MIKILAIIMVVGGAISLVVGIMGVFGSMSTGVSPWALAILGGIFFLSGISLLKYRKDTDVIDAENKH
ncbi:MULTISPECIES: hypothetical protein [Leeuwenhoekiella]|jgi:hypothetical protein|uniref:Uncharacterized protein n=1 Tax=Leeuwenhoekiella blandensis (strain CECT 7118 / CCUG 51940 / KCTC 22103 / MED217) TaxID=398720 RepID=A3XJS0_LEEBM|nr:MULTISPECIES: hypothetical protein [Leeuwenhoekiella]EAQ50202.1 hypothetical protein MED217_04202 [Leeuwenhoekiella blandensis MED217]MAO43649.1 hypothetical protein [Leeuwenhoekiella sp.]MBQ51507.1 hypothetical protein [Leeuwenhoekiella sp.]HBT08402.1 hypothetical protein [Leeuwenhoekiella sp.]HCW64733.1 hypothetical protein [Leeuwenhoekiella sp.]|tara:strand:+ start:5917 stop:6120 length:204 start_codon:yes stop_codon:yes gene_type:complete